MHIPLGPCRPKWHSHPHNFPITLAVRPHISAMYVCACCARDLGGLPLSEGHSLHLWGCWWGVVWLWVLVPDFDLVAGESSG